MAEVTEADQAAALAFLGFDSVEDLHYWAKDNNELNRFDALAAAFAAHREAERQAVVDWLLSDGARLDYEASGSGEHFSWWAADFVRCGDHRKG